MKKLLVLLLLYSHLFSFSIDESVLNIHATLLPKLALMDLKYQEKLKDGSLNIVIFYSKRNLISAKYLRRDILTSYPNGIKKSPIKVRLCPYRHVQTIKANIYYLMPATKEKMKKVLLLAQKNKILTFSYSKDDLAHGSILALNIGKKVKPIINLKALKESNISIRDVLLKISTVYKDKR